MARYELGKTQVQRKTALDTFTQSRISSFALGTLFLEEPYHFIPVPEIHHKVVASDFNTDSIDFYDNKSFTPDQREAVNIGDQQIIDMLNLILDDNRKTKRVNTFYLRDGDIVIVNEELVDPKTLAEKIEPTLDFLVGLSVNKDGKNAEDYLILRENHQVKYIAKSSIAKCLIPYMSDWFDAKFPGLMVDDGMEESKKLTDFGFKLVLSLFANEVKASMNLKSETLPSEAYFTVSTVSLDENILSNGLSAKQLKPFVKFLKGENNDLVASSKSLFAGKNVLTELIKKTYDRYETVSWPIFVNYKERFEVGCTVVLAPGQVITDKQGHEVFNSDDVYEIYYKGPKALVANSKNTVEILVTGDSINPEMYKRTRKYFKDTFGLPLKSLSLVKDESNK